MKETKIIYINGEKETKDVFANLLYVDGFSVTSFSSALPEFEYYEYPSRFISNEIEIKETEKAAVEAFQFLINHINNIEQAAINYEFNVKTLNPELYQLDNFTIFVFTIRETEESAESQLKVFDYERSADRVKRIFSYGFKDKEINRAITGHKDFRHLLQSVGNLRKCGENYDHYINQPLSINRGRALDNIESDAYLYAVRTEHYINDFYKIAEKLQSERKNKAVKQENFIVPTSFHYPIQRCIRETFNHTPTPQEIENEEIRLKIDVSSRNSINSIYNFLELRTSEKLLYFDYICFSAWYTLSRYNEENYVTYLDIANTIHKSKSKSRLESNDTFVLDVEKSITKMRSILASFNFTQEAEEHGNRDLKKLLELERTEISVNLINAIGIRHITKNNNTTLAGIQLINNKTTNAFSSLFFEYINATKQIRTLENEYLVNPLSASIINSNIFHYMLNKLSAMPYYGNEKFLTTQNTGSGPRSALVEDKQCIIKIDSLIETLDLQSTRRTLITKKMEKILNFWKSQGYINGYDIIKEGRTKTAYLLSMD